MGNRVERITPSTKVKGRFYLEFENGEKLTVTINQIADFSLFTGRELSDEEYTALKADARKASAKASAIRMLGSRSMSRREITGRLTEKGIDEETAEETAEWLTRIGAIDDGEYAGMIVRHYSAKGYGINRIKDELYSRGIPREMWEDAISAMPDNCEKMYKLLCLKLGEGKPDRAGIKRAGDFLYRRGFTWDEIKTAVERFNNNCEDF